MLSVRLSVAIAISVDPKKKTLHGTFLVQYRECVNLAAEGA